MARRKGNTGEKTIIVGRNPVFEAVLHRPSEVDKVYVQSGAGGSSLKALMAATTDAGIQIQFVPRTKLNQLAPGETHQGVVALVASISYLTLEDLLESIGVSFNTVQAVQPLLLVLDRIQDPHNYGAILRSAAAAGVGGIIVPTSHMSPLSAAAVKASAGTAGMVPVARVPRIDQALVQLKEVGCWVVGLDGSGDRSVWETDWNRPVAIVVGSEGEGIASAVRDNCDEVSFIPMYGGVESLNVSVASAIALFAAAHQRETNPTV